MALSNTRLAYSTPTRCFHWIAVALFAFQYGSGLVMTRLGEGESAAGLGGSDWYNWHKTMGLIALAVALGRLVARNLGELPDWAPSYSAREHGIIHRAERLLYLTMFVMPVSGFVLVMAGGYGVLFAGRWTLPNPVGKWEALSVLASWVHLGAAILLAAALAVHLVIVARHLRHGLLARMLPGR